MGRYLDIAKRVSELPDSMTGCEISGKSGKRGTESRLVEEASPVHSRDTESGAELHVDVCWHCHGEKACNCIACYTRSGDAGPCAACKGTGTLERRRIQ